MLQQARNMRSHGNTIQLQMDVLAVKKRPYQIFRRNTAYPNQGLSISFHGNPWKWNELLHEIQAYLKSMI